MIPYEKSFIGYKLLFRVHGSPLFRSALPGFISVILLCVLHSVWLEDEGSLGNFDHPYGIGVLISSVSFLIIFRANYGYQRYWSACGDTHHFTSKLLDAAVHVAIYHMQQTHYDCIKPPNYYDNHDLNRLQLSRDRENEGDFFLGSKHDQETFRKHRATKKSINEPHKKSKKKPTDTNSDTSVTPSLLVGDQGLVDNSKFLLSEGRLDGGWGSLFDDSTSTYYQQSMDPAAWERGKERGFASTYPGGRTHSLFLQELLHLFSLLNAVAYSTLRNDIEDAMNPLDMYHPGAMFPKSDPRKHLEKTQRCITLRNLFGMDRSPRSRARYNESRPLSVLGGVSSNEIKFLQRAKGPSAKVTLTHSWIAEFIIREDRAGSLGNVGPPIISRVMQFLSDAQIYYNHCRKTMFIPFPFPHAQLSAFFNLTIMVTIPLLMYEYTNKLWLGCLITFMTVTCISGLHEVSRELENPFKNTPNEIPLVTLQAMFNESLISLFSGYHPDHFWDGDDYRTNEKKIASPPRGNGKPASRRLKTPPTTPRPLENRELSQTCSFDSSKSVGKSSVGGAEEEISVQELRKMVMKQKHEIKRLSEMYDSCSPIT